MKVSLIPVFVICKDGDKRNFHNIGCGIDYESLLSFFEINDFKFIP